MRGSLKIATVGGIPIRVHWSFPLLLLLVVLAYASGGTSLAVETLVWIVAIFASVVFHEFSHAVVARRRGLVVRDIVLLPIGGVSEIPDLARTSRDELPIAVAGPAASFALAGILAVAGQLLGGPLWPPAFASGPWVVRLAWANALLGAFNLLPAFPLDGGRVLRAALERSRGRLEATSIAVRVGRILGGAMVVVGIFVDLWLVLIGFFIMVGGTAELRTEMVRAALEGLRVGDLMVAAPRPVPASAPTEWVVPPSAAVVDSDLPVVDGDHYLGMTTTVEVRDAPPGTAVGAITDRAAPLLDAEAPLFPDAIEQFSRSTRRALPVGRHGTVVGLLREADIEYRLVTAGRYGGARNGGGRYGGGRYGPGRDGAGRDGRSGNGSGPVGPWPPPDAPGGVWPAARPPWPPPPPGGPSTLPPSPSRRDTGGEGTPEPPGEPHGR